MFAAQRFFQLKKHESIGAKRPMNYPPQHGRMPQYSRQPSENLGLGDWIAMLMRELWLMFAVFSVISLLGIGFAMTLQKKYTAEARLSVLIGDEYVYTSNTGRAGEGQAPKQEEIVQSEVEILTSAQVAARVIKAIGLEKIFEPKDLIITQGPNTPEQRFNIGVEGLRKQLSAFATPNTTVIKISLANKDPQIAADSLNKLLDEYLIYRREVLFEDRSGALADQTNEFATELSEVQSQLSGFLSANGLSDYEAEKISLQNLLATVRQDLLTTISRRIEAEGRYNSTAKSFAKEPNQIQLSFETDTSKRKIELQSQLAELLTKYTENSQPVMDLKRRIAALDEILESEQGKKAGIIKTGPNPVRDSLATESAKTNAEVIALREREQILNQQVEDLQKRTMQLAMLRPDYEELIRKKTVLEEQVRQFSTRQAAAKAQTELNAISNDNIRVIQRAIVPTKGKSMKKLVAIGALLFAGFCGLIAGFIRALSRNDRPVSKSVSNALGMPILATITR